MYKAKVATMLMLLGLILVNSRVYALLFTEPLLRIFWFVCSPMAHGAPAESGTRRVRLKIRCRFQQFNYGISHEIEPDILHFCRTNCPPARIKALL